MLGKPCGGTISLHNRQALMECGAADAGAQMQLVLQRHGCAGVGAYDQYLVGSQLPQQAL